MDHVPPADIIPELKVGAPLGTVTEVTVCGEMSSFVQVNVLFFPMTMVTLPGRYPEIGAVDEELPPAPFGIEIGRAFAGTALLDDVVLLTELEEEDAPPPPPDPATTSIVPTIVVGCTEQK